MRKVMCTRAKMQMILLVFFLGSATAQIIDALLQSQQVLQQGIANTLDAQKRLVEGQLAALGTPQYYQWQTAAAQAQQYNYQYQMQNGQLLPQQTQAQQQPQQQQQQQQPQPQQVLYSQQQQQQQQQQPQQAQSQSQPQAPQTLPATQTAAYDTVPRAKVPLRPVTYSQIASTPAPALPRATTPPPTSPPARFATANGAVSFPQQQSDVSRKVVTKSTAPIAPAPALAPASASAPANSHTMFSAKLFDVISSSLPKRNIVYSPISLQTLLALIYTGASGTTAQQLRDALVLPPRPADTAVLFHNLLKSTQYDGDARPIMANKLYHKAELRIVPDMREKAITYFDAEIEPVDFAQPQPVAARINDWVAAKTQNRVQDVIEPSELTPDTQAILVSAIYFKAKWAKEFSTSDTELQPFAVNGRRNYVNVPMMYNDDIFRFGQFNELDATALEMPYANSRLSMMIILPNQPDGLYALEQRLQGVDLNELAARMQPETVTVRLPKFHIEFELDMVDPMRRLGVSDIFTQHSEIRGFFPDQPVGVSKMQHKAYIDVNEAGSEATAASFVKLIPLSLPNRIINFTANHPFMFAIRSPQAVYFIGHVVNF